MKRFLREAKTLTLLGFLLTVWLPDKEAFAAASPAAEGTEGSLLLTVEGRVEVAAGGGAAWNRATTNQVLNVGDRLRTGFKSRATMRLSDLSILRIKELTTLQIRPPETASRSMLDLRSGAAYFYNREKPSDVRFRTPQASGAVRGTEFHLEVTEDNRTVVTLLDGEVGLTNEAGAITLNSGEEGVVEAGQAPKKTARLDAINVIQWTLYYPAVIDVEELALSTEEKETLKESLSAYRRGDLLGALAAYPENREPTSDAARVFRGAVLLSVGLVEETQALLDAARSEPGLAGALRLVIASVKQQPAVLAGEPGSASEWLARSYYLQGQTRLLEALEAARRAAAMSPGWGAAWVRVAELEFGFGRSEAALEAVDRGLEMSASNAQGMVLKGFILSSRHQMEEASLWFDRAIAADGALANGWLGRGLTRIRLGQGEAGRGDLQAAAALEPNRSIIRSYLGKAFSHTGRLPLAEKELDLARKLDPGDPTPWLYSALLDQQQNRVNRAVRNLERSQQLNDNRALFRSRLLLDQDQSVRSANLAAIYRDAGMTELSFRESARAVNHDYANFSAHLFLANSYDALRDPKLINLRYETAWFSELLVANLLAPVGAGSLSQSISQQEYSRFFEGDHLGLVSSTEYLSSGDWTQSGSQYGVLGQSSYSLDAFYRTDQGQRSNNDLEQLALSARFKQQLTPEDSVFIQASYFDTESGDVAQYYFQEDASRDQRVKERQEPNLFLGYHHQWKPGVHTLFLGARLDDDFELTGTRPVFNLPLAAFPTPIRLDSDFEAYSAEVQQIWQFDTLTMVAGSRYQQGESTTKSTIFTAAPVSQTVETDLERFAIYSYNYWQVAEPLQLMAGLSYDRLDYPANIDLSPVSGAQRDKDQLSPKAGFYLTPWKQATFRGIYTRSLGGLFYDNSVRLEPTQLAGFNQAFRSVIPESVVGLVAGSEFETFGLALDQQLGSGTYLSVAGEVLYSEADREVGTLQLGGGPPTPSGTREEMGYRERSVTVTLDQLVGDQWVVGARYRLVDADLNERFDGLPPALRPANGNVSATLHQLSFYANWNLPCGFFLRADSVWSQQSNRDYSPDLPGDDFWQHHLQIGYRFLARRAEARLGLLNVFDHSYRLNPLTLYYELPRERTLAATLRFYF